MKINYCQSRAVWFHLPRNTFQYSVSRLVGLCRKDQNLHLKTLQTTSPQTGFAFALFSTSWSICWIGEALHEMGRTLQLFCLRRSVGSTSQWSSRSECRFRCYTWKVRIDPQTEHRELWTHMSWAVGGCSPGHFPFAHLHASSLYKEALLACSLRSFIRALVHSALTPCAQLSSALQRSRASTHLSSLLFARLAFSLFLLVSRLSSLPDSTPLQGVGSCAHFADSCASASGLRIRLRVRVRADGLLRRARHRAIGARAVCFLKLQTLLVADAHAGHF